MPGRISFTLSKSKRIISFQNFCCVVEKLSEICVSRLVKLDLNTKDNNDQNDYDDDDVRPMKTFFSLHQY